MELISCDRCGTLYRRDRTIVHRVKIGLGHIFRRRLEICDKCEPFVSKAIDELIGETFPYWGGNPSREPGPGATISWRMTQPDGTLIAAGYAANSDSLARDIAVNVKYTIDNSFPTVNYSFAVAINTEEFPPKT